MKRDVLASATLLGAIASAIALTIRPHALDLLLTSEYSPRRSLYLAHPWLLWTNVVSDVLVALSYALFLAGIYLLVRRLKNIPQLQSHLWVFSALGVFIGASAATCVLRIVNVWWPLYQFTIGLKVICAAASIPAAVLFVWQSPKLGESMKRFFGLLETEALQRNALMKSELFLERIGKVAGVGGWEVDIRTRAVTWSEETYRILGAPIDYVPTLDEAINMYAPEAQLVITEAIEKASAGGGDWDLELRVKRLDGRWIWTRSVGTAELLDGAPVRLTGSFQDVTSRVSERRALQSANERIEIATDSGGIGIWDWDLVKGELLCDAWMHRLHGKDPKETARTNLWRDHLHPEDKESVEQALLDALDGRRPYDMEFRIVWQDGSVRTLRGSAKVNRDAAGKAIRMVGANWDVSDSRRLTAQLAEQHEMLDVTLRSICDGVISADANGGIVWMNPAAEQWTGCRVAEAIGQPLAAVLGMMSCNTDGATIKGDGEPGGRSAVVEQGKNGVSPYCLLNSRDGKDSTIEVTVAPIRGAGGESLGSVMVLRDISEQQRLAAETQRVVKLKDEFLSHVSHELRSPLSSIYSFSSIIADDLAGETTPQQQEYLGIVLKNVAQLQSMIEDLLTVTQSREGKLSVVPQPVTVAETITDALHVVQGPAARKNITLVTVDCSAMPMVYADPTRLQQVMIILLDNAIKFTPAGGTIRVNAAQTEPGFLLVQVEDSGCGIPEDKRTKVFENLYQVTGPGQADTQAGRTGLGLGLHIARNLVTRQGGYIWVTEAEPQGSVFNFTLPIFEERRAKLSAGRDEAKKTAAGALTQASERKPMTVQEVELLETQTTSMLIN